MFKHSRQSGTRSSAGEKGRVGNEVSAWTLLPCQPHRVPQNDGSGQNIQFRLEHILSTNYSLPLSKTDCLTIAVSNLKC